MKKNYILLFILCCLFSIKGNGQKACKKVTVSGKVTFTALYKGGARPSPEVLEACCQPRPMANSKLYLKKNYYSPVQYIINTDSSGNFKRKVKQGLYKMYLKNEIDATKAKEIASGKINQNDAWITEPYFVMEAVPGKDLFFTIDIRERRDRNEIPKP